MSAITSPPYVKFDYKHFPVGSLALWSHISSRDMCDAILQGSISLWVNALESYYNKMDEDSKFMIVPRTKCWKGTNSSVINSKYHFGEQFHE